MHVQCIQFDIGIGGSKIMQVPQVKLVCFESVLLEVLKFQQKKFKTLLKTPFHSLLPYQVNFL